MFAHPNVYQTAMIFDAGDPSTNDHLVVLFIDKVFKSNAGIDVLGQWT
jgi:hypothetical protein